ncbi:sugar kinase [Acidaminobacter hydrogenoformans]|uniref:2-dehydro-3-deoxygluconokinase n=1 Tax=Acidaminobacter hydrogenoformans DSM 2784 TaxID=1120920 RepID=A0A1G5RR58_9FIRM|nr:sugar kinase [Acidaminobacter hydrogenoformans]SCZ76497.1 2-dehydro-3-deoxygluconokinase [Acidaminobacter hydrogenoformans DSM 2784]
MAKKVVTMGEIMLRLSSPGFLRFNQSNSFDVVYGGGEANVAVSLANYGLDAYFVSKLPKHEIGQCAVEALRKQNVKTDFVARGGDRVGIYFLETGASMRPSKVVYDRANSAISEAEISDFDFDAIFKDAEWFHFTGITPALGPKAAALTEAALIAAKKHGVTVSVDLNFRKKLWTPEQAQKVMTPLMQYVDVCIGNEEDAEKVLGFKPGDTNVEKGELELAGYMDMFRRMQDKFNFKYVATSLRESYSASDNGWSALIYDGNEFYHSKKYEVRIVDRVGGGDSFASGLIYGLISGKDYKAALEFGVAASALKHTIFGDFNLVTVEEVEALVGGDASGRVQR